MDFKQIPYLSGGRELCVPGCAILVASYDFLGDAIRACEGNHAFCNHAAAVVRTPDATGRERVDIHLIESLEHGPTKTHLSDYFTGFKGRLFLFRPAGLTPEIQTAFTNFLAALVASHVRYDYLGLLENIAGHTAEIPAGKEIHECICSAECGYAWERNGLPRKPDAPQHLVPQPPDLPVWWEADGPVIELLGPFR